MSEQDKLVVAMMNAESIAQTLVHHGQILEQFEKKVNGLTHN